MCMCVYFYEIRTHKNHFYIHLMFFFVLLITVHDNYLLLLYVL